MPSEFEKGALVGLLIGEGHFGGDGRQAQVTLRMHVKHVALFHWIERTFPGGKLYGPYYHGGRHYLQWMARGSYLRDVLLPILDEHLRPELDAEATQRYEQMKARYQHRLRTAARSLEPEPPLPEPPLPVPARPSGRRGSRGGARAAEIFDQLRREQQE